MQPQHHTHRMICHVCQRPAHAESEARVPYCVRHALRRGIGVQLVAGAGSDSVPEVSAAASG